MSCSDESELYPLCTYALAQFQEQKVPKPNMLGTKAFLDVDLKELLPYIDWNPFFQVWQLRGKYPNRGYPKIFNDETVGEEAKKLHNDALKMLDDVCAKKQLQAKGVIGIWPANRIGDDDIALYTGEDRKQRLEVIHTLRQQTSHHRQTSSSGSLVGTCHSRFFTRSPATTCGMNGVAFSIGVSFGVKMAWRPKMISYTSRPKL